MAAGVPSSLVRFICFIPTGMLGFNGVGIYNSAKKLGDIYGDMSSGDDFLQGLKLFSDGVGCTPRVCCRDIEAVKADKSPFDLSYFRVGQFLATTSPCSCSP